MRSCGRAAGPRGTAASRAGRAVRSAARRRTPRRSAPHSEAIGPNRSTHARAAHASASSASANGRPDARGIHGPSPSSTVRVTPMPCNVSVRRANARSQPRTVPGGRSSLAAIVRCPVPCAWPAARSQSPTRHRAGAARTKRAAARASARIAGSTPTAGARAVRRVASAPALARPPPPRQRRLAVRAGDPTSRQRRLQPLADCDRRQHPNTTFLHARTRASHKTREAGGATRVAGGYHAPKRGATAPTGRCRSSVTREGRFMPNPSDP